MIHRYFLSSKRVFVALLLCGCSAIASAQQMKSFGDYDIHYSAYNSTFLAPNIAKIYGITRGSNTAILTISVQPQGGVGDGVTAEITGKANNLIQQVKYFDFKEIKEGRAIYYVSSFKFDDEDALTFDIEVKIGPTGEKHHMKWQQRFWED
ncbi:MAG: DUF4426 domain-containing protein [Pseudomonadales bacterium]